MSDPTWVVCLKCGSKWQAEMLERKGIRHCQLCLEPGLRIMDAKGNATEETFPRKAKRTQVDGDAGKEVMGNG
jgi:hypothetical protein